MKQSVTKLVSEIGARGYARLHAALPSSPIFSETYKAFDTVAERASVDELVAITLEKSAEYWTKDFTRRSFFAGAPMGYRNRSIRADKAKKSYFQYAPVYGSFVRENFPHLILAYPEIDWLFAKCDTLWNASVDVLHTVILEYDRHYPGIRRLLVRQNGSAPVILRLLRYEPGEHIESQPHYDKSAFTVHMHSDDEAGNQFVIGRWHPTELLLTDLAPVARQNSGHSNDAVVFPGLFLSEMGYQEILPSPHAALGSNVMRYRHVSVGFRLVPFMSTDHLITNVPFKRAA